MKLPNFFFEKMAWDSNFEYVIGVDEVGRGSFAGPVVASATVFRKYSIFDHEPLSKINDSKLLRPHTRESLSVEIKKTAMFYDISSVKVSIINKIGIGKATQIAIRKCIYSVINQIQKTSRIYLLIDGHKIKYIKRIGLKNQNGIIRGDSRSISIAAASIIAKVYRDDLMRKLDLKYSKYGFSQNKGYGTQYHQEALRNYGLSDIHRTSFNLAKYLN